MTTDKHKRHDIKQQWKKIETMIHHSGSKPFIYGKHRWKFMNLVIRNALLGIPWEKYISRPNRVWRHANSINSLYMLQWYCTVSAKRATMNEDFALLWGDVIDYVDMYEVLVYVTKVIDEMQEQQQKELS